MSYGPNVRVRAQFGPVAPFTDLLIEVRDIGRASGWREVARVNDEDSISFTLVEVIAQVVRRSLVEGEKV